VSYELYVEPEALDELKRLAKRHKPAVMPCIKIGGVIAQTETFAGEIQQGHYPGTLVETVVDGRVWQHAIPDTVFGAGPPFLDVRVLIGTCAASLFHVAELTSDTASQQAGPEDHLVQAVARSLIDKGDDDAS
jgi:hypothetical protein